MKPRLIPEPRVAAAERRDLEPTPFDIQRQYVEGEEEAESPLAV